MKNNIKNMVVTGILASVLMVGATSAHAGLLVSDRSAVLMSDTAAEPQQCTQTDSSTVSYAGLLVSDFTTTFSVSLAGLLVSDRNGLLVSDKKGLLVSELSSTSTCN